MTAEARFSAETAALAAVKSDVNEWTRELFTGWSPPTRLGAKVVRDPLHDFVRLEAHEVGVWDTPVVQRLRHIHQTGLAYLLYPGLHQTRFEHSIGVMYVADTMVSALSHDTRIDPRDRLHVRLAALLHDVGHVPFSHLGEAALEDSMPGLQADVQRGTYRGVPRYFDGVNIGEVLSYLIIVSPAFVDAFRNHIATVVGSAFGVSLTEVDLHRVGRMIIGKPGTGEKWWPAQVINGSFDADKLDYIMRDSHASGIQTEVDTTRLIHSLRILDSAWEHSLAVAGNAVNYLEQIMLAKLTLYTALYHHHKTRAVECMVRSFFMNLPSIGSLPRPATVGAWLRLTEYGVLDRGASLSVPTAQIGDVLNRRLLQRCLVLDRNTVDEASRGRFQTKVAIDLQNRAEQGEFRQALMARLPTDKEWVEADLWIDVPKPPDVDREAQQCHVELAPGAVAQLSELMPADDWVRSYVANKLRGHVFYQPSLAHREVVAARATELLSEAPYNIRLNDLARRLALKT